jgi:RNA polymerase sigma-70 factor (ECF subfamily)
LDQDPPGGPPALELREVFRTHSAYVATLAFRLLGRDDEIDDVVQEVFLSALSGLRRLQSARAVRSWLATVTARKVARRIRGRRLRALFFRAPVDVDYEAVASPDADPEQRAQVARLYATLDGMPAAERVAWALRHVEGERLDDVARLTGCSLATAKRRIASAQQRLERTWSDE